MRCLVAAVMLGVLAVGMAGGSKRCATPTVYDYVIVGSGPSGSILAAELSKDERNSVLLIEEGSWSMFMPQVHEAAVWFSLTMDPLIERGYETVAQKHLGGRVINLPRARVTGGCGNHNGMVYFLGNEKDYERWNVEGWGWEDLKGYWEQIEATYSTETLNETEYFMTKFLEASVQANFTRVSDANNFEEVKGRGHVHVRKFGAKKVSETYVRRESAWIAYVEPLLDGSRPNLDVVVDTRVDKVLFKKKNRAYGVRTTHRATQRVQNFYARKEVIVTAGAYDTPKLLQLSGVGDCDELAVHGIACTAHVPGVGKNLQDHTFSVVWSPPLKDQSVELPAQPFGLYGTIAHEANGEYNLDFTVDKNWVDGQTKCIAVMIEPFLYKSRGTVKLASANPAAKPVIDHNYFGTKEDEAKYVEVVRRARDLLYTPALKPLFGNETEEVAPGWHVQTDEQIVEWGRTVVSSDFHPGCTCKMATDFSDPMAVVDKDLRVRGTENLRIVDASIFPVMVAGNPNQITMIVALKAADIILGRSQNGYN